METFIRNGTGVCSCVLDGRTCERTVTHGNNSTRKEDREGNKGNESLNEDCESVIEQTRKVI